MHTLSFSADSHDRVVALMTTNERSPPVRIHVGSDISATTFTANGEYLVSGGNGVRVWLAKDGKEIASMEARSVACLAVSKDGRWIAAGTLWGYVFVWDTETFEQAFTIKKDDEIIYAVDFSPDSTRLVTASSNCTAIVWDVALCRQVQTLQHENLVTAAKYSRQGDRIATNTYVTSVRVWDSNNGRLLVEIQVGVTPWDNAHLLWSNNHLSVISGKTIKSFETSTGSSVWEWPVLDSDYLSCVSFPQHGEIIAYSTKSTVTFWDTSTDTPLDLIQHPEDIFSITHSPDDRFLAIAGKSGEISISGLSHIPNSTPLHSAFQYPPPTSRDLPPTSQALPPISQDLHPNFQDPDIQIDDAALDSWKHDQLENAEAILTAVIHESQNPSYHVLASRALVRTRLQQWDAALVDAEKAIDIQPSVFAFIAKSIAHVGKGEKHKGYRACDIAFKHFHSHVAFLLLVKAIIVFIAGEHRDAISRVDDLIATVHLNSICYVVQAYMYFLLGNSQMERSEFTAAIQSFQHGRAQMRHHTSRTLFVVSLISGWKFDDLGITIRQRLCEAMYATGRTKDAVDCFHQMTGELREEANSRGEQLEWVSDFRQRSSKKLEYLGDSAADTQRYDEALSYYTSALSLSSPSPQGILIKRSKAFLATGSWRLALDDANQVITLDPSSPWGYEMKHAAL
ncbi:WD40 repeat-like protein, partial [Imleria badia]